MDGRKINSYDRQNESEKALYWGISLESMHLIVIYLLIATAFVWLDNYVIGDIDAVIG